MAATTRWSERVGWLSGAVFVLALGVRLAYLWDSAGNPTFFAPVVDSETYDRLARAFVAGRGLSHEYFWQPFFYPAFLSLAYAVGGSSIVFVKLIQALVGATTAVITFRLGRVVFDTRSGLLAGAIVAGYGPLIFFDGELLSTVWAGLWSVTLILLFLRAADAGGALRFGLLGLAGGLSVVTRPTFLPFFVAGCVWLFAAAHPRLHRIGRVTALGMTLLGVTAVWTPVAWLAREHTGRASIFPAAAGVNLYVGNNPDAERSMVIRPGSDWSELTNLPRRYGVTERKDTGKFFLARTADYVRSDPSGFLRGLLVKSGQLISSRELPRNLDLYVFREWSRVLRWSVWKIGRFGFPFGVLLPLAAGGTLLCRRRLPAPLGLFLTLYPLSIVLVFAAARYRAPVIPVLAVVAAGGCFAAGRSLARGERRPVAAAAVVAAVALAASILPGPFPQERVDYTAELHYFLGTRAMNAGDLAAAANHLRKATERDPGYSDAQHHLGLVFFKLHNTSLAIEHLELAVRANPRSVTARKNLARVYAAVGRTDDALHEFRAALEYDPLDADLHYRLGALLLSLGRYDEAEPHLRRSLQLRPGHPETRAALARALRERGR